jgi:hypothetical protein
MSKKSIKENEFSGAPGGTAGSINYQTPYGTPFSPNFLQDPDSFEASKFNTVQNKAMGDKSNTAKDFQNPEDMQKAVDQIYSKKKVPTADQVKAGLDFELHNMIKPDKHKAKELVLGHLREDPDYYGKLHQLNIDDKSMQVDINETLKNVNVAETKKIFDGMVKKKETKYVVNSYLVEVMEEMWKQKKARRMWQKGDPTL